MLSRFRIDRGAEAGLTIDDLDVDRYALDGRAAAGAHRGPRARPRRQPEPELAGPAPHQHPRLRAGDGAGGRVLRERPARLPDRRADRPELYFSPSLTATPSPARRRASGPARRRRPSDYAGTTGVQMSSFVRRAAFALAFLDYNVLGSGAIDDDSQMLWVRNVRDRLEKLAPFLSYDGDPYPVVVDGRVLWVVDAYTYDEPLPVRPAHRQRRPADARTAASTATPTTSATASRPSSTPTTASVHVLRHRRRRPDHPGVGERRSATCSRRATRCRPSCASTCATPRTCSACRPTSTRSTSSTRSSFFERDGAWSVAQAPSVDPREPTSAGGAVADRRPTTSRRRPTSPPSRRRAGSCRTTRCSPTRRRGGDEFVLLRPFVPFSPQRPAHRAAGVHDGVERPRHLRPAHRVRRRPAPCPTARAPSPTTIDSRTDDHPADHAADRRRQPGALRRPAARAGRRRAAVGAPVLRRRRPEQRPRDDGHRVPVRHRRPTTTGPRTASRSARRWPSCSPGSRRPRRPRRAPTSRRAADDRADDAGRAGRRARRPSCWPQADQLLARGRAGAAQDGDLGELPGQGRPGRRRSCSQALAGMVPPTRPADVEPATAGGRRGRLSCSASRARSSRNAIW